jgi:hypothetical protein
LSEVKGVSRGSSTNATCSVREVTSPTHTVIIEFENIKVNMYGHFCNEPMITETKRRYIDIVLRTLSTHNPSDFLKENTPPPLEARLMTTEEVEFEERMLVYLNNVGNGVGLNGLICLSFFFYRYFNSPPAIRIIDFLGDAIIAYNALKFIQMPDLADSFLEFMIKTFKYNINLH